MKIYSIFYLLFGILIFSSCSNDLIPRPDQLRVSEGFRNPIGFYDAEPTFSWQLPANSDIKSQKAYQIVVASSEELLENNPDFWDSGKQENQQSAWVKYEGEPLKSRDKVYWRVRFWNDEDKMSAWSEVKDFELGLLENKDWKGQWIGADYDIEKTKDQYGNPTYEPQYLRKEFEIPEDFKQARLYVSAKGVFEAYLNGEDVSDDVMSPGWTPYQNRIETLTYDVTEMLKPGKNALGFILAAGWYSGRMGFATKPVELKLPPKILCQLEVILKDNQKVVISTDKDWSVTKNGPIRFAQIYDGEVFDANFEMEGWHNSGFNDSNWTSVLVEGIDPNVKLEPKRHTTVRNKQILEVQNIVESNENAVIYDFGQNMVGVPELQVPMVKGDTLRVRFSEMLSPDGSFYTDNYRSAKSTNYYISSETGMVKWIPKFTFHGFQYIELTGFDKSKTPDKDWVKGLVQYSDFDTSGQFETSHEKLNQLQSNIEWGLKGNFFEIPTDCPQRDERLGWTGDAQVISPTALFNFDMYAFWASWLQSMRETQSNHDDGLIPFVIPDVLLNKRASSGWGDAATIIPWDIYRYTGDKRILEENFDMMKKWVGYHQTQAENYISDMYSFSDWLQPYAKDNNNRGDTPRKLINTAFFAHSAHLTAKAARELGKPGDAEQFQNLYENIAGAFEAEFFDANGEIKDQQGTQTGYLLALHFDLIQEENKPKVLNHLLHKINEADNHLRTGFLGTPLLPFVLDTYGHSDLMYQILLKETYPSWFYSINQGATTMWERWNSYSKEEGYNPQRMNSLNHYAYGAIGQWMYERIAGIMPLEPGYKKIKIAPLPNPTINSVNASTMTPYGEVKSAWAYENSSFTLEVTIPANTTARVILPNRLGGKLLVNGEAVEKDAQSDVVLMNTSDKFYEFEVQPGNYQFETTE